MASFYNHYYRYYNFRNPSITNKHLAPEEKNTIKESPTEELSLPHTAEKYKKDASSRFYSFGPINFKNPFFTDIEEPVFEIMGIHLYLDDVIILGLLFFLYQEGVQDEMLFISLILLLLS